MHTNSKNDRLLMQRLKAGDESAYEQIYLAYHKSLYGLAVNWLKNRNLAKDAVQNVYIKLWDYRKRLDPGREESLEPLLTTFLKNEILNTIRNQNRRIQKHMEMTRHRENSNNSTEESVIYADYKRIMEEGLKQLTYRQEQIHRLKTLDGLTNKEVATKLDISIHAVKSQYYLATRFLRDYMRKNADLISAE